jgi:prophage regulatory protein
MEPIFLRINDVTKLTSISRSSIYRMISEGDFPIQIPFGNRQVRWSRQEVLNWCEEKLTAAK